MPGESSRKAKAQSSEINLKYAETASSTSKDCASCLRQAERHEERSKNIVVFQR